MGKKRLGSILTLFCVLPLPSLLLYVISAGKGISYHPEWAHRECSAMAVQPLKISQDKIRMLTKENKNHQCDPISQCVRLVIIADLPSRFGEFQICGFTSPGDGKEHTALVKGDIVGKESVLTRLHSECLTGDALGSKRCDCRDQLIESLERIEAEGEGILLYLRQEGRNIGLTNKIKAYYLQDMGVDTVDANIILGFEPDERDYGIAAHILRTLDVKSIRLLTNNPKKIQELQKHGVKILERVPLVIEPTEESKTYLDTKEKRAGHLLGDLSGIRSISEVDAIGRDT
ncbi:MAG: GTP cyclohydrolase II [Candidatus Thorarchaeota archaeon]|nr:MAG: GTP cyclohydrolase II [Candidatus Thorarchaeota archaeon]